MRPVLGAVRAIAVAVAMIGSKVGAETVLFLGWFGPRGLASILFALLVVDEAGTTGADTIMLVVSVTVVLSIYAHGLAAAPWARGSARRALRLRPEAPERVPVTEHHVPHRRPERHDEATPADHVQYSSGSGDRG